MKLKSRRLLSCLMAIVMVLTLLPFDPLEVGAAGTPTLDLGNPVRGAAPNYKLSHAAFGSTGVVDPGGGYFKVTVNNGSTALGTLPSGITELTDGIKILTIVTDKSTSTNRVFNFSSTTTYEDIRDVIRDLTFTQAPGQTQRVVVDVTPGAQLADGKTSVRTYNGRYFVYVARPLAGNMTFYDALTAATNSRGHLVEPKANNPQETLAIASMFKEFKSYWKDYSGDGWSFISFIGATKTTAPNWNTSSDTLTHYVSNTAQHTGLEATSEFYNNDPNYDHLTLVLNANNTAVNYVSVRNIHGASTYKDPGVIVEYDPGAISIITATIDIVLPAMGGNVAINGVPKVGEPLTIDVTGITYTPNTTGNVPTYQWYRDGVAIANATGASYTLTAADIGGKITVEVTADGVHATGNVTSTETAAVAAADGAAAPTNVILDASAQTLSWNHVSGYPDASDYEYSLDGGMTWTTATANPQTLTSVPNPVSNAQVRVKEDTNAGRAPGAAGTAALPVMGGSVAISGVAQVGQALTASVTGITYTPNTTGNVPTYQWYRDGAAIANATGASYTLTAADIGGKITVKVTADGVHATGHVTSTETSPVAKADGPAAPGAPVEAGKTTTSITLTDTAGQEYSKDGGLTWQDSPTFSELVPDTEYSFVTRVKATATQSASSISEAAKIRTSASASSGGVTPSVTPKPDESGIETSVNGKDDTFATGKASTSGDRPLTSVQVDLEKLNPVLLQNNGQKLAIHSPKDGDMKVEGLTAGTVKQLADKGTSLEISSPLAIYPVPGGKMDLGAMSKQLGDAALSDIAVRIDIARSSDTVIANAKNKAAAEGYELLVTPVDLDLTFSHEGKTARSEQLNGYAAKYIALPDGIDPNRITTGVIINENGSVYHVPTVVTKVNNRYYAWINDLRSHGSYSVIWNPKDFDDVKQHWGKTDVNNIAARLDLAGNGDNTFSPNRNITRSEFSEIVVAGLGLMRHNAPQNKFSDVSDSTWYRNSVAIANEFDIVRGYESGNFYGDRQITREQGMAMIARAYQLIEPRAALGQDQIDSLLAKYEDAKNVSAWAREDVARMIEAGIVQGNGTQLLSPQSNMTRAEVTALIARLLKTTNLIDK